MLFVLFPELKLKLKWAFLLSLFIAWLLKLQVWYLRWCRTSFLHCFLIWAHSFNEYCQLVYNLSLIIHTFNSYLKKSVVQNDCYHKCTYFFKFLIIGLTFASYSIEVDSADRLAVNITLFLTAVAFKLVVKQSLPTISYLTYLVSYIFQQNF